MIASLSPSLRRKLRRDLASRWMPLLALAFIMAIGISGFVGMASVFRDMDGARAAYYENQRLAHFTVDCKRAPAWAVDELLELPNVKAVRPRTQTAVRLDLPGQERPISGLAIGMPVPRRPVLNDVLVQSGTWFSSADSCEVVVTDAFARAHGLRPGSRLSALVYDRRQELLVVGTAMSPEFVYTIPPDGGLAPDHESYGVLYLPERYLQGLCDLEGACNQVVGLVHDDSHEALANTLQLIEERLEPYGVTTSTPRHEQSSVRFLADELTGVQASSRVMPVMFLGVAALVLNILISRLVVQQRTVIGTLKALGHSARTLQMHYLAFGVTIGLVGGLVGVLLGLGMQQGLIVLYRMFYELPQIEMVIYPDIALTGLAISVTCAGLGTIQAVRYASRLAPAEAMRPPPPERGGAVLLERIPWLWRRLPFHWKLVWRTIFRNPFRSSVATFASFLSTALIVAAFSLTDAVDFMIVHEYDRVAHQDLTLSLRDPRGPRSLHEAESLPTITYTEPQLGVMCDLRSGAYRKRVGIVGLPEGGLLHTPVDRNGNAIVVPEQGLVLARKLAEILHVEPGDTIDLRPLIGRRTQTRAVVVATSDSYLGLGAYARLDYLSALLGEEPVANAVLASTQGAAASLPLYDATRERPSVVGIGERQRSLTQIERQFGETMGKMIGVIVFLAGMIAFGSVLNAALVSLSERQREVATLRVIGYSPVQVAWIFSGESLILGSIGVATGLAGGIGLAHLTALGYDTEMYRFPAVVHPERLVHAASLMVMFLAVAQLAVLRLIRRLDWLDVLKERE